MKVVLKINKFIQDNILKWYYFISIYLVISLMNFGFISLIIPTWGCYIIEILLTGFLLYYIAVVYSFIRDKYKKYMISRMDHIDEQMLKMHQYINELDDNNRNLFNERIDSLIENLSENSNQLTELINDAQKTVVNTVESNTSKLQDSIIDQINEETQLTISVIEKCNRKQLDKIDEDMNLNMKHYEKVVSDISCLNKILNNQALEILEKIKKNKELFEEKTQLLDNNLTSIYNSIIENVENSSSEIKNIMVDNSNIINEKILELNSDMNRSNEEFKALYKEKTQLLDDNVTNVYNSIIENVTNSSEEIKNIMADDRTMIIDNSNIINEKILELNSDINRNDEEFKALYKEKTQLLEDNLTNIHNSIIENVTSSSDEIKNTMADDRTMIIDTLNQDVERVEMAVVNNSETINNNISEVNANISNNSSEIIDSYCIQSKSLEDNIKEFRTMVSNNMTDSFGEVKNIMANYNDGITETLEKEFNKVEDSFADKTDKIKNSRIFCRSTQ